MKKSKLFLYISLVLVILAIGIGVKFGLKKFQQKKNFKKQTIVSPTYVNIKDVVEVNGEVVPKKRIEIKAPLEGRIDKILVKEGDKIIKGQKIGYMSSSDRAILLDALRQEKEEDLEYWNEIYKETSIIAPISGKIIAKKIEDNQTVSAGSVILVVADELIVKIKVDETDLAKIKKGQIAQVYVDAYPKQKIKGQVAHIAYEALKKDYNRKLTFYEVQITFKRVPEFFRTGMSANVSIKICEKEQVLSIPLEALVYEKGKEVVKIFQGEKQEPINRELELGIADDKNIEVISGLTEKDKLIIEELEKKKDKK